MEEKRYQPKKFKLPPLVDRSETYDTLSFDNDTLYVGIDKTIETNDENHSQNYSQSISELESL